MSAMRFERYDHPRPGDLLKTVIAAEALEQERQLDQGLYLERDTLLDDEFSEPSLDDFDDLLADAELGDWER